MNLKKQLENMNINDLIFICKQFGVKHLSNKRNAIKLLLLPLSKKYGMNTKNIEIVEEDDVLSDWEDDELSNEIDRKFSAIKLQKSIRGYITRLKLIKKRRKRLVKKKIQKLTQAQLDKIEQNRKRLEKKKIEKEKIEKDKIELKKKYKREYEEKKKKNKEQIKIAKKKARQINEKRGEAIDKIKKKTIKLKKTKMCKHGQKCKRKGTCNFAHTTEELQLTECAFGKGCKRIDCYYNHKYGRLIDDKCQLEVGRDLLNFITKKSKKSKK